MVFLSYNRIHNVRGNCFTWSLPERSAVSNRVGIQCFGDCICVHHQRLMWRLTQPAPRAHSVGFRQNLWPRHSSYLPLMMETEKSPQRWILHTIDRLRRFNIIKGEGEVKHWNTEMSFQRIMSYSSNVTPDMTRYTLIYFLLQRLSNFLCLMPSETLKQMYRAIKQAWIMHSFLCTVLQI
jgi:hypothetical protein